MGRDVQNNEYIDADTVEYWYFAMPRPKNETSFSSTLRLFLNTPSGRRYQADVKFESDDGHIIATRLAQHQNLKDTDDRVNAMISIRHTVDSVDLRPEKPIAYGGVYLLWEDVVIRQELFRNVGLAILAVFLVTLLLNIWTSLLVLCCVVLTLVDTGGMMHFWGLTINGVTSISLILATGLAVGYSGHIGHAFMVPHEAAKTRKDRAILVLRTIGTAVWNGGFSTFLAFVLLAGSESYILSSFFTVLFLIVVFGLFHGLFFLPVVLSLVGPSPYSYKPHIPEQTTTVESSAAIDLNDSVKKRQVSEHDYLP